MNNPKLVKIASIVIGVIISISLLIMGLRLFSNVFTRASDMEPRDVVVSDVNQNSTKISWATGVETQGVIEYGTTPTALNFFAPESTRTKSHEQELTLLSPNTTYYFQIRIGDHKYDNGGVPWTVSTRIVNQPTAAMPTVAPTGVPTAEPSGTQSVEVPATSETQGCNETDCNKIKEMLGKGCTTQDYILCLKKPTPTASPSASPSATPAAP